MAAIDTKIEITPDAMKQLTSIGGVQKATTASLQNAFQFMSLGSYVDTGLIPVNGTGLLSYRQGPKCSQVVYQVQPGKYHIMWSGSRTEGHSQTYWLSQPYRIIIGDLLEGELLGCRQFYSPIPITNTAQPLYHTNLANVNCLGYGQRGKDQGNGVGWLCLYHNESWQGLSIGQKIEKILVECSGFGQYNDNMTETDGPYFYKKWYSKNNPDVMPQREYLWNPNKWQEKSDQEGFEWTVDDNLWIPVLVQDVDHQDKHKDGGEHLTLDMAMRGAYNAYYTDPNVPKPFNSFSRADLENPTDQDLFDFFSAVINRASGTVTPKKREFGSPLAPTFINQGEGLEPLDPKPKFFGSCAECKADLPYQEDAMVTSNGKTLVCKACAFKHYGYCVSCKVLYHVLELNYSVEEEMGYCFNCKSLYSCPTCAHQYDLNVDADKITADGRCTHCSTDLARCDQCQVVVSQDSYSKINAKGPMGEDAHEWTLCTNCASSMTICPCGFLRDNEGLYTVDMQSVCQGCVTNDVNGNWIYQPQGTQVAVNLPSGIELMSQ